MADDQSHAIIHIKISDSEDPCVDDPSAEIAKLTESLRIANPTIELMAVTFTNLTQAFEAFRQMLWSMQAESQRQSWRKENP